MKTWAEMSDDARDGWIAEHVMGYQYYYGTEDDGTPYALLATPEYLANWEQKFGTSGVPNDDPPMLCLNPQWVEKAGAAIALLCSLDGWLWQCQYADDTFLVLVIERATGKTGRADGDSFAPVACEALYNAWNGAPQA